MGIRILIIGGVAGGATAAARARRIDETAEIILFERGEYISFANCGLPYFIGNVIDDRDNLLVTTPKALKERYRIDVRIHSEVTAIDRQRKEISVHHIPSGKKYNEPYDKIILSPGAEPLRPPLPGIDAPNIFNIRNIPDTDRVMAYLKTASPETALIVGGGFIGLEMAENLTEIGLKTTVVEMLDQVMPPLDFEMAAMVHGHLKEKGVTLDLGNQVESFEPSDGAIVVHTRKKPPASYDLVVLSIGVRPENALAKSAGLAIGERGAIMVNAAMQTSDPDIYAVGDAVEINDFITGSTVMTPLAGPANKQGRIAAENALGRKSLFKGTQGTAIVKVFDTTVAVTGAGEKNLKRLGIPFLTSTTHSGSHAGYYPGAQMMAIKLLFSPGSGKLLGAQAVGEDGVDKRIDVLATAIRGKMTVFDLEELELAYAPPYGSAKDPVNIAGFVAANLLKGDVQNTYWHELGSLDDTHVIIDLRDTDEIEESGKINSALHIPVNDLRDQLGALDKTRHYVLYCAVGLRGYIGYRILVQNGFKVTNLAGGYKTFLGAREKIMDTTGVTGHLQTE